MILLALAGSFAAHAQASLYQQQSEEQYRQIDQELRAAEDRSYHAHADEVAQKLMALNPGISVSFNENVRTDPIDAFGECMAGEWVLSNGGSCVENITFGVIQCHGAKGFSLKALNARAGKRK